MQFFVSEDSVVRKIWGKSDTILFIFAGAAAEFALNKAVDWLYFTGKLPTDPLGRLFSTVRYARMIVFAPLDDANHAIATMTQIHKGVENKRGAQIPDWAYRDVLFMLIYYSIASYQLLEKKLTQSEKQEVYDVFYRVGKGMGLKELPENYATWLSAREQHLLTNLEKSDLTVDLFKQYRKHLSFVRYKLLIEAQKLVVPKHVIKLMGFSNYSLLSPVIPMYKLGRLCKLDGIIKAILLPPSYKNQIKDLDVV
ncbi:MAG: oxygenase MpaB family protein [Gilvibacter sp.]